MSRVSFYKLSRKANVLAARLRRNCEGVAAVEFGLLAPVLLVMLLGTVELSRAISIDRKFGLVTSTIADLIAREKSVTAADVTAMYDIVDHLMKPWDASTLQLAIIPVKSSPTNGADTKVYAATTNRPSLHGAPQAAKCAAYTLTANMLAPATSVIVIETSYSFRPMFVGSIIGSSTWTDKAVLSPRNSCVDFDSPSNCVSNCWAGG
ncbi:MAG: TadE/TadG family type IV pilus assembly protein [Hyphomicrobium sp.]